MIPWVAKQKCLNYHTIAWNDHPLWQSYFLPVLPATPTLTSDNLAATVMISTKVNLVCSSTSVGAKYTFYNNDTLLQATTDYTSNSNDTITLSNTNALNPNLYTCKATVGHTMSLPSNQFTQTVVSKYPSFEYELSNLLLLWTKFKNKPFSEFYKLLI